MRSSTRNLVQQSLQKHLGQRGREQYFAETEQDFGKAVGNSKVLSMLGGVTPSRRTQATYPRPDEDSKFLLEECAQPPSAEAGISAPKISAWPPERRQLPRQHQQWRRLPCGGTWVSGTTLRHGLHQERTRVMCSLMFYGAWMAQGVVPLRLQTTHWPFASTCLT